MSLAVLIPTYRRPSGLRRALASLGEQTRRPDEIVVVDNAPDGQAEAVCAQAAAQGLPIRFIEEPRAGVSNARNAAFAATDKPLIAQLDDDESASSNWLQALVKARETLDTPLVFGPVEPVVSEAGPVRAHFMQRLYARRGAEADVKLDKPHGCGNSLLDRAVLELGPEPFDPAANQVGGEDDILFNRLMAAGAEIGWAAQALVYEHVDPARARWSHLFQRAFAYGQGPSQTAANADPADWLGVAGWMGVGAGQMALFVLAALPARLVSPQAAAACLDRAAQGAGKLVWGDFAAPRFYG
ncbi:MAG: glycosyltransferase family 2 protein [Pseudomonadota bacterium]